MYLLHKSDNQIESISRKSNTFTFFSPPKTLYIYRHIFYCVSGVESKGSRENNWVIQDKDAGCYKLVPANSAAAERTSNLTENSKGILFILECKVAKVTIYLMTKLILTSINM